MNEISENIAIDIMNEVIGSFMDYTMYDKRYPRNHGIGAPEAEPEKCMIIQKAKYHESWDWLMPVWYKFIKLRFENALQQLQHSELKTIIGRMILYEGIELSHYNLFQGIQWYNQNKQ